MIEEFEKYLIELKLSQNTYSSYTSDLKQYIEYYEDSYGEKLTKLTGSDIQTYISYLKNRKNLKPTSINRKITALKTYNGFLVHNKIQDNIVINKRDYIKIQPSFDREDVPDEKQINLLRHSASISLRDYCVIVIAAYGGLRETEIVNIKLIHIHLEERFIEIFGKGNKYRTVIINDIMFKAIEEYLEERKKLNINGPYLFAGKKTNFYQGKPLNRNFVNRILDKYCKLVNLNNIHPHSLRSYFCTRASKAGYTLLQIASQAGHSSINTTRRYIGKDTENLHTLSNKI